MIILRQFWLIVWIAWVFTGCTAISQSAVLASSTPSRLTQTVLATSMQKQPAQSEPLATRRTSPGYNEKQGYPKEQSAQLLSPEVRTLLDALLRFYTEPGLFTNRKKVLETLGVRNSQREWSASDAAQGGHRSYTDHLAAEGLLAHKGWKGRFGYGGKRERWSDEWRAGLSVAFDQMPDSSGCIDSRAVEGYLDLVLDPGLFGTAHPRPWVIWRHENLATPFAVEVSNRTPKLIMTFNKGCLLRVRVSGSFEFKEINDDNTRDQ